MSEINEFNNFLDKKIELKKNLNFLTFNQGDMNKFLIKKDGIHIRIIEKNLTFIHELNLIKEKISKKLSNITNLVSNILVQIIFDNKENNMIVRKLSFLEHEYLKLLLEINSLKFSYISDKIYESQEIIKLISLKKIPQYYICQINENFFNINFSNLLIDLKLKKKKLKF